MSDKLNGLMPKIVTRLRMLSSNADGEKLNAVRAILDLLEKADLDIHDLVERLEGGSLSAAEVQHIYDQGYSKGFADGAEKGRRSAVIASAMPMTSFGSAAHSDVGPGINGYSWLDVAKHCADNKHRISRDKDKEFVDSVFEQIAYRQKAPSPPQAKWLGDIFKQRFAGRID